MRWELYRNEVVKTLSGADTEGRQRVTRQLALKVAPFPTKLQQGSECLCQGSEVSLRPVRVTPLPCTGKAPELTRLRGAAKGLPLGWVTTIPVCLGPRGFQDVGFFRVQTGTSQADQNKSRRGGI